MKPWRWHLIGGLIIAVLVGGWMASQVLMYETVERTDYKPPPPPTDELVDDQLDDNQAPPFDPELINSQPIDDWQINLSAAVTKLDVEMALPDAEDYAVTLHPSFSSAGSVAAAYSQYKVLPSVNLVDAKAKQFGDGLYAALDLAYYRGLEETLRGHVDLVRQIAERAGPDSPATPYLAAALELAGVTIEVKDKSAQAQWRQRFDRNPAMSKPIGFYTWNDELKACFRFLRFLQQPIPLVPARGGGPPDGPAAMAAIAQVLQDDLRLRSDYEKALAFYSRLTNSPQPAVHLLTAGPAPLLALASGKAGSQGQEAAAFFPSSTSRENELFEKLFPQGLPPNTDLMKALIRAVRSGEVDLTPRDVSGWYDYQAYALETLLLPERGEEAMKLLRTARYKRRMLEAFAALMTKRRETQVRSFLPVGGASAEPRPLEGVSPRLRVEPHPTYFLRTARAYAFLQKLLEERLGREQLASLHGLTATGERSLDLAAELNQMRTLFFGLYLVSCDDLGMRPSTTEEETGDPAAAMAAAEKWLAGANVDPDLAADTRVIVPVYHDQERQVTSVWATAGVRLVKLTAEFDTRFPPHVRPASGGDWKPAESHQLGQSRYLIAVDEFVTCELPTLEPLSREEFRTLCDKHLTKEKIVAALQAPRR